MPANWIYSSTNTTYPDQAFDTVEAAASTDVPHLGPKHSSRKPTETAILPSRPPNSPEQWPSANPGEPGDTIADAIVCAFLIFGLVAIPGPPTMFIRTKMGIPVYGSLPIMRGVFRPALPSRAAVVRDIPLFGRILSFFAAIALRPFVIVVSAFRLLESGTKGEWWLLNLLKVKDMRQGSRVQRTSMGTVVKTEVLVETSAAARTRVRRSGIGSNRRTRMTSRSGGMRSGVREAEHGDCMNVAGDIAKCRTHILRLTIQSDLNRTFHNNHQQDSREGARHSFNARAFLERRDSATHASPPSSWTLLQKCFS